MTVVLQMSTDRDIIETRLSVAWNPVAVRYSWLQVCTMDLNIAAGSTLVVIAHGNGDEIGNARPGSVDVNAETFLALIQGNMTAGTPPAAIYISTCGPGIAQFAAAVRIAASNNGIWAGTEIFGHSDPIAGPVPPPDDRRWFQIFA